MTFFLGGLRAPIQQIFSRRRERVKQSCGAGVGPLATHAGRRRNFRRALLHSSLHSPMVSIRSISCTSVCLILLLATFGSAVATVSLTESTALSALLVAFPSLSHVQQDFLLYPAMNGTSNSWPSTFSTLCSGADGYEIHGIRCAGGHVDTIF